MTVPPSSTSTSANSPSNIPTASLSSIVRYFLGIVIFALLIIIATSPTTDGPVFNPAHFWWSAESQKTSIVVKGVTFVIESNNNNQEPQASIDNSLSNAFANFNYEVTRCFAKLTKNQLVFDLTDKVKKYVHAQLVQKRESLREAHIDEQHEEWVVKPWIFVERQTSMSAKIIRAVGACFRGGGLGRDRPHSEAHWAERAGGAEAHHHPFFFPLHGGVSPRRLLKHALRSAEYLGLPSSAARLADSAMLFPSPANNFKGMNLPKSVRKQGLEVSFVLDFSHQQQLQDLASSSSSSSLSGPIVVVDLGCGHGAMLAAMCPPHPRLWCYGVDFTEALIQRGQRAFRHLDLKKGVSAPHIPSGHADSVLSNGVAGVIRLSHNCQHFEEIIRLLKPNRGVGIIWHLSTTRWARFHPTFFADASEEFYLNETRFSPLPQTQAARQNPQNKNSKNHAREFILQTLHKPTPQDEEFIPNWGRVMVDPFFEIESEKILERKINVAQSQLESEVKKNKEIAKQKGPSSSSLHRQQQQQAGSSAKQSSSYIFPDRIMKMHPSKILSRCPGRLGRYISRIDIIADDPHAPIYTPSWDSLENNIRNWPGTFGARIFRNDVIYDEEDYFRREHDETERVRILQKLKEDEETKKRQKKNSKNEKKKSTIEEKLHEMGDEDFFKKNLQSNNNRDDSSYKKKKFPTVLNPPLGLELMHRDSFPSSSSSSKDLQSSTAFSRKNISSSFTFARERARFRHAFDAAIRCDFFEKGRHGGWCPKERIVLE